MSKTSKKIQDLKEFKEKNTFIFLYDRILYIERLINKIETIDQASSIPIFLDLSNLLSKHYNIDIIGAGVDYNELIYVLYRSMFQAAKWENEVYAYIDTKAYFYDDKDNELHTKICNHVNCKTAHQDNLNAVDSGLRYVYDILVNENGIEYVATLTAIKHSARELKPLISKIKSAILKAYKDIFGKNLPCILSYEPLEKRL